MDPITVMALASAAMALIKQLMPQLRDAINGGDLTPEQEAKARAEYESLRGQLGGEFTGSHWQLSGR